MSVQIGVDAPLPSLPVSLSASVSPRMIGLRSTAKADLDSRKLEVESIAHNLSQSRQRRPNRFRLRIASEEIAPNLRSYDWQWRVAKTRVFKCGSDHFKRVRRTSFNVSAMFRERRWRSALTAAICISGRIPLRSTASLYFNNCLAALIDYARSVDIQVIGGPHLFHRRGTF